MMKTLICLLLLSLVLTSCTQATPVDITPSGVKFSVEPSGNRVSVDTDGGSEIYIESGVYRIDNIFPGAEASLPLVIGNNTDKYKELLVSVRIPDHVAEGYNRLPEEYYGWITIGDNHRSEHIIGIEAQEAKCLTLYVTVPNEVEYNNRKDEIWISVVEKDLRGFINIELCSRILISSVHTTSP